jgi:signal peptidase II
VRVRVLLVSLGIVVVDQCSKLLVRGISLPFLGIAWPGLPYGVSHRVLGDFLRLTYVENPGMAFGIDVGGKPLFAVISVVASVAILLYLYKVRHERLGFRVALAMILGGAVGNLVDRVFYGVLFDQAPLFYGKVVDFIDVDFFNINLGFYHFHRWPVFNLADACVTIGVILVFFFHRTAVHHGGVLLGEPVATESGTTHEAEVGKH